jgi:hypothetical protein
LRWIRGRLGAQRTSDAERQHGETMQMESMHALREKSMDI